VATLLYLLNQRRYRCRADIYEGDYSEKSFEYGDIEYGDRFFLCKLNALIIYSSNFGDKYQMLTIKAHNNISESFRLAKSQRM